ncbi:MAG: hypothetical protein AAFV25_01845 [Bacteroidota bacterium]
MKMLDFVKRKKAPEAVFPHQQSFPETADGLSLKRPVLMTGVGRSGTHFLAKIFNQTKEVTALHLDDIGNDVGDSFYMYCKWNGIPVDLEGLFSSRRYLMQKYGKDQQVFMESNPYMAFLAHDFYEQLNSRILFVHRDPYKVVRSHYFKGWYKEDLYYGSSEQNLGFQYHYARPNHFFGRITPKGSEYDSWQYLSRVGKIAWMWATINQSMIDQLKHIPSNAYKIIRIEDFDHDQYVETCQAFGLQEQISRSAFDKIVQSKPGKGRFNADEFRMTDDQRAEFDRITGPVVEQFSNHNSLL